MAGVACRCSRGRRIERKEEGGRKEGKKKGYRLDERWRQEHEKSKVIFGEFGEFEASLDFRDSVSERRGSEETWQDVGRRAHEQESAG